MLDSPESATLAVTIIPVSPEGGVAAPGTQAEHTPHVSGRCARAVCSSSNSRTDQGRSVVGSDHGLGSKWGEPTRHYSLIPVRPNG